MADSARGGMSVMNSGSDKSSSSSSFEALPQFVIKQYTILARVIQERTLFDWISILSIAIEDLQLVAFFATHLMSRTYYVPSIIATIFDSSERYMTMQMRHFDYIVGGLLCLVFIPHGLMLAMFYISEGSRVFRVVVTSFRLIAFVYPSALLIPMMGVFMAGINCPADSVSGDMLGSYSCFTPDRLGSVIMSLFGLVTYLFTSLYLTVFIFESNPMGKTALHKAHPRVDMLFVVLKAGLVAAWVYLPESNVYTRLLLTLLVGLVMFGVHNMFFPYFNIYITQMRCGTYFATIVLSIASCIITIVARLMGGYIGSVAVLISYAGLFILSWPIGFVVTGWSYKNLQTYLRKRVGDQTVKSGNSAGNSWTDDANLFYMWAHPEVAARFGVNHIFGRRQPKPEHFAEITLLFERGLLELPGYPQVTLMYALYLFHVTGHREGSYRLTKKLDIRNVFFDTQLQLFIHVQAETKERELAFLETDVILDVASANEYSRIIYQTKLNHFLSLHHARQVRRLVLDRKYESSKLEAIGEVLYLTSEDAEKGYEKLIDKFPESAALYRFYSHFARYILCDEIKANQLLSEAEALEADVPEDDDDENDKDYDLTLKVENQSTHRPSLRPSMTEGRSSITKYSEEGLGSAHDGSLGSSKQGSRSASNASFETGRARENNRIRTKMLQAYVYDMRLLLLAILVIGVVSLGVLIASNLIVNDLITATTSGLTFLKLLHEREIATSLSLQRCRQIQEAHDAQDYTAFKATQEKLYNEMMELQFVARETFRLRDSNSGITNAFYSEPMIAVNVSYYPQIVGPPQQLNVSLLQLMLDFSNSGLSIATTNFTSFPDLNTNNDYRFIADNWYYIKKGPFDYSMDELYFATQAKMEKNATTLIYVLTAVQATVVIIFLGMLDMLIIYRFRKTQTTILNVFRLLPLPVKNELFRELDEAINEDMLGFEEIFGGLNVDKKFETRHRFRLQYTFYGITSLMLAFVFAYLNSRDVYEIGQLFGMFDQIGDMKTYSTRGTVLIKELLGSDTQTWPTRDELIKQLLETYDDVTSIYSVVMYGDPDRQPPTPPFHSYLGQDLKLTNTTCLLANDTNCEHLQFNPPIGLTEEVTTHGIVHLQDRFNWNFQSMVEAASANGDVVPEAGRVELAQALLEPYIIDGWSHYANAILTRASGYFGFAQLRNNLIFAAETFVILFGQVYVFGRMYRHFKFMLTCNVEHVVRLPKHVRKLPEIVEFMNQSKSQAPVTAKDLIISLWCFVTRQPSPSHDDKFSGAKPSTKDLNAPSGGPGKGKFKNRDPNDPRDSFGGVPPKAIEPSKKRATFKSSSDILDTAEMRSPDKGTPPTFSSQRRPSIRLSFGKSPDDLDDDGLMSPISDGGTKGSDGPERIRRKQRDPLDELDELDADMPADGVGQDKKTFSMPRLHDHIEESGGGGGGGQALASRGSLDQLGKTGSGHLLDMDLEPTAGPSLYPTIPQASAHEHEPEPEHSHQSNASIHVGSPKPAVLRARSKGDVVVRSSESLASAVRSPPTGHRSTESLGRGQGGAARPGIPRSGSAAGAAMRSQAHTGSSSVLLQTNAGRAGPGAGSAVVVGAGSGAVTATATGSTFRIHPSSHNLGSTRAVHLQRSGAIGSSPTTQDSALRQMASANSMSLSRSRNVDEWARQAARSMQNIAKSESESEPDDDNDRDDDDGNN
ncbi:hypothetical protein BC831DRAFT_506245 [Entophlyctis helioformis]|nr:hypothetical protein BC831DRAFT_506245 [Entophlyctis helioformis]